MAVEGKNLYFKPIPYCYLVVKKLLIRYTVYKREHGLGVVNTFTLVSCHRDEHAKEAGGGSLAFRCTRYP